MEHGRGTPDPLIGAIGGMMGMIMFGTLIAMMLAGYRIEEQPLEPKRDRLEPKPARRKPTVIVLQ